MKTADGAAITITFVAPQEDSTNARLPPRGTGGQTMRTEYIFPTVLIFLDLCAALVYAAKCEWRMGLYWAAAATLTACVTYTGGRA